MFTADQKLAQHSYYAATAPAMAAQPVLQGQHTADVCVVGAGLAGLSAALELANRGLRVVVLEARQIAWGASGRNGGQAIVGYACGEAPFEHAMPLDEARAAFDLTLEGLDLMRTRIQTYNLACDWQEGFMTVAVRPKSVKGLYAWAERMARVYDYPYLRPLSEVETLEWIDSRRFCAGVLDANSAHLHPLKYARGIAQACLEAGVQIFEHSQVVAMEANDAGSPDLRAAVRTVKTALGEVKATYVVLAGNVYLHDASSLLAPKLARRVMPVGTYMVATEVLPPEVAARLIKNRVAVCDNNFVLDYFRVTPDDRLLFGGRVSYSGVPPANLMQSMRQTMLRTYPQLAQVKLEYCWGGFVDVTMNRAPDFGRLAPNVYYLQGFSGHGLILTGIAGKLAAEAILGQAERFDWFGKLKHRDFWGGRYLRTPTQVLGMLYYRMRDYI